MAGVRILTYNTQCRSWGMEAGAQGTLDPITSVEERAALISDRILSGTQQYDVVCLNEVFDEDAREVFANMLGPSYPHSVRKADAGSPVEGVLELVSAASLLSVPVNGWLDALDLAELAIADLMSWEDSGLMLFSRLPFDQIPTPPAFTNLGVPDVPVVVYVPYEESAGNDSHAAKGVVYARLRSPAGNPLHMLISHTQADSSTAIGEHADVRANQFEQVRQLLTRMAGDPSFAEEVVFCGDFNVNGLADQNGSRPEWTDLFDSPGTYFTDALQDPWVHEQRAQDLANPGSPLPIADPGATTHAQRLDYMLRPTPSPEFPDRLALQHMAIAFDVAQASGSSPPNPYTSDHLPLRIDLNFQREHNTLWTAEPIDPNPDVSIEGFIDEDEMHWYRIEEQGGYGFALGDGPPQVAYEIYTADNLSVPVAPFTTITETLNPELPPLTRFALPSAPFFIRVFHTTRRGKANYRLHVHRYEGREPADAIPLMHRVKHTAIVQTGTFHSLDRPETPFDDTDCVWFVTKFDEPPKNRPEITTVVAVSGMEFSGSFGMIAAQRDANGVYEQLGEELAGADPLFMVFAHNQRGRGYILVKREDPSFSASHFDIELSSDVSYMYALPGDPSMPGDVDRQGLQEGYVICEDETDNFLVSLPLIGDIVSELGSDDIGINFSAEGDGLVHIPNSDDMEFDDDTKRALVCGVVRYGGDAEIELVEMDDLSAADRTSITVPQFPDAMSTAHLVVQSNPIAAFVIYRLAFDGDDGIYYVALTVSSEPPPVP